MGGHQLGVSDGPVDMFGSIARPVGLVFPQTVCGGWADPACKEAGTSRWRLQRMGALAISDFLSMRGG